VKIVGERFEQGEAYSLGLLMAADTFNAATETLRPEIWSRKRRVATAGKLVLGAVKGNVHHIGKNIVAIVLETREFLVVDIEMDVPCFPCSVLGISLLA
jgi:5-methyltetrahydrofolate--homocysteine methyltransferase